MPLLVEKVEEADGRISELEEQIHAYEVLLDDRDKKTSPGVKFADMELIGIPHRVVISDRGLADGTLEYKHRRDSEAQAVAIADILPFINARAPR